MPVADLVARGQEALLLAGALALPLVAIAAAAGLVTSALLGAAGVQDGAASQLPRLAAVVLAIVALSPWMGRQLAAFAARMLAGGG